ncbi:hypothetical protein G9A89_019047 [Geosiphon pyriformis]|nr:hypothetical protein G9A89_019047 [Geosiphon pyriformis]
MTMLKQLLVISFCILAFSYAFTVKVDLFENERKQNFLSKLFSDEYTTQQTISDCGSDKDILQIEYIHLSPDPPRKGRELAIDAAGYLQDKVEKGSYVDITVKLGLIRLLQQKMDLCDELNKVEKNCPLEAGNQTLQTVVELPKEIPPGKYSVDAFAYTPDRRRIACLKAVVIFKLQ